MEAKSQQPKRREGTTSALNRAAAAVNLAEKNSTIPPAKAVFRSIGVLLTLIRVCFLLCCNNRFKVHMYLGLDGR
jgi:hypothetical protein